MTDILTTFLKPVNWEWGATQDDNIRSTFVEYSHGNSLIPLQVYIAKYSQWCLRSSKHSSCMQCSAQGEYTMWIRL